MNIIEWAHQQVKAQTIWDIGILKICCILAGMILGASLSAFVMQYLVLFIVVVFLLAIILMVRFFFAKG